MDVVSLFNTIFTLSGAVILLSEYVSRFTKADGNREEIIKLFE